MGYKSKVKSHTTALSIGIIVCVIAIITIAFAVDMEFISNGSSRNRKLLKKAQELEKRLKCITCRNCRGEDCKLW